VPNRSSAFRFRHGRHHGTFDLRRRGAFPILRRMISSWLHFPEAEPAPDKRDGSGAVLGLLLAMYVIALLFVIPTVEQHHGDERYYDDAALRMIQTGDYWTPYYGDGRIRLLKPIISYWVAAFSFKLLGVSLVAARLPFLLAGAMVVALTYQLGRTILGCRRTALLAALVLASNIEMMVLSVRTTPDMLLCLFVLASMWGFARIWFQDDRSLLGPMLAFGGMGLAVQTKGLLGLCPLAANAVFCMVAWPGGERLRRLLRWQAIGAGVAIGLFWYAVMLHRHGAGALRDFFSDQVTTRIEHQAGSILGNLGAYLFAGFRHFLPWTALVVAGFCWKRKEVLEYWKRRRAECFFLVLLFVILVAVFAMGNMRRPRYLAAAYPLLALFLAATLSAFCSHPGFQRWIRRLIGAVAVLMLPAGAVMLAGGGLGEWRLLAAGGLFVAVALAGLRVVRAADDLARWTWLAGVAVVVYSISGWCFRPVFSPRQTGKAAMVMKQMAPPGVPVHTWQLNDTEASIIRIFSEGTMTVKKLPEEPAATNLVSAPFIITQFPHQQFLESEGFRVTRIEDDSTPFTRSKIGRFVLEKAGRASKHKVPVYWVAERND
jgi:4-amino-4-deoxy-L-arabinose transferase-like glycosyltransferase